MANIKEYTKQIDLNRRFKLIYTAGPYTSRDGNWGMWMNIIEASKVAHELMLLGYATICPHTNAQYTDSDDLEPMEVLQRDLELIRRCDAVVLCPKWITSRGVLKELELCKLINLPVFKSIESLEKNQPMSKKELDIAIKQTQETLKHLDKLAEIENGRC